MKTITYDPAVYKLVPVEPFHGLDHYDPEWKQFKHMLAAVPADLPGVVETGTAALQARIVVLEDAINEVCSPESVNAYADALDEIGILKARIAELTIELAASKDEEECSASVCDKLALILAGVAVALKGEELPLHKHSFHDLAEVAATKMLEIDLLNYQHSEDAAKIAELEAMVAAQEPVGYRIEYRPDRYTFMEAKHYDCNKGLYEGARFTPLYAAPPAPASAIAIVQAALDAAATECNRMMMFPGGRQESYAHHGVDAAAAAIRAIDPATIIDEASK